MGLALGRKRLGGRVEAPKCALQVAWMGPHGQPFARERPRIRAFHRTIPAIAASPVRRANRAAARMGHRTEARSSLHHDADAAALLALDADAMAANGRLAA